MADNADLLSDLTPAERRRVRVRTAILDAAERVFAEAGADGLSIRRLADEIDYSPAAIYKYFGSKEELIEELQEAFFERLLTKIDEARQSSAPFAERARQCCATYVNTALEKPHHYAAAFSGVNIGGPEPAEPVPWDVFLQSAKGQAFAYLCDMVREGQETGALRRDFDPVIAAKSVWASSHGIAVLMMHMPRFPMLLPGPAQIDRAGFLAAHADLVIRGLEVPPGPAPARASSQTPRTGGHQP